MEQYLLRLEEQVAKCKESIQETKQIIEQSRLWLSTFHAQQAAENPLREPDGLKS